MLSAPASQVALKLVTAPAVELFSASDEVVQQMIKPDTDANDDYLDLILAAARGLFEEETGLCLITQTWQASWDSIPRRARDGAAHLMLSLGRAPLIALTQATYLDADGDTQTITLSGNLRAVNVGVRHSFGMVALEPTADWPDLGEFPEALKVQFTAGFGAAASNVPETARLAVLQLAAHWYENRLPVAYTSVNELPLHLKRLLDMHRVDA